MKQIAARADITKVLPTGERFEIADSVVRGLRLRVSAAGVKSWSLLYRTDGGFRRLDLGLFDKDRNTLADARSEALKAKGAIRKEGADPQAAKAAKREQARAAKAAPKAPTVGELALQCVDALKLRPATRKEWRRLALKEISKAFPKTPAKDLTRAEVKAWTTSLAKRAGYVANRSLSFLSRVYAWAGEQEIVEASPCVGVKKPFADEVENERVLSLEELRSIMRAVDALDAWAEYERKEVEAEGPHAGYLDVVRLLMLTGVRREAVLGMRREELEGLDSEEPTWTLPGGRSKSGKAHVVPLSVPALEVIRRRLTVAPGACLFPVSRLKSEDRAALVAEFGRWKATEKARETDGQAKKDRPATWSSRFVRELKATADAIHGEPLARWRVHDFRSTLATHARQILKVRGDVVSAIIGHTPPGSKMSRVYNRADLLDEKREALVAWAALLEQAKSGESKPGEGAKVLPMRARA